MFFSVLLFNTNVYSRISMPEIDDDQLMVKVKNGDISAFDTLVRKWEGNLYNFIYRRLRDHQWTEDARQEIFLRVCLSTKKYKPAGKFQAWLYKIALNHCKNELKKRKRSKLNSGMNYSPGEMNNEKQNHLESIVDPRPQPEDVMARNEIVNQIQNAINNLPEKQRIVIELYYYENLKFREIADILGCSKSTIESRMRYALEKLRNTLECYKEFGTNIPNSIRGK